MVGSVKLGTIQKALYNQERNTNIVFSAQEIQPAQSLKVSEKKPGDAANVKSMQTGAVDKAALQLQKPYIKKNENNTSRLSHRKWNLSSSLTKKVSDRYYTTIPKSTPAVSERRGVVQIESNAIPSCAATKKDKVDTNKTPNAETDPNVSVNNSKPEKQNPKAQNKNDRTPKQPSLDANKEKASDESRASAEKKRIEIGFAVLQRQKESYTFLHDSIRDLVNLACN